MIEFPNQCSMGRDSASAPTRIQRKQPFKRRACVTLLLSLVGALGCGEEEGAAEPPAPPPEFELEIPALSEGDGHWNPSQRGVALDVEDEQLFSVFDATELSSKFRTLVLNRPLIDWRIDDCLDVNEAAEYQPAQTATQILETLRARGVNVEDFDQLAVNVSLLNPSRTQLLQLCLDPSGGAPSFFLPEHRAHVKAAFRELAQLPNIGSITVGLEMNNYRYLLELPNGIDPAADYLNFVTLYKEIYQEIKEVNSEIRVGPGLSWNFFMNESVPTAAQSRSLSLEVPEDRRLAVHLAQRQHISPFLKDLDGSARADFVAWSMIELAAAPFNGDPAPVDEVLQEAVREHYRYLQVVSEDLPVVLPQIDWRSQNRATASLKSDFLETLKAALSHVEIEWAAWRRLGDILSANESTGTNACDRYIESVNNTEYSIDYCYAGMLDSNGQGEQRGVYAVMTTDP
ncbi:MAG: hypothetical protein VYD19_04545, partial [Myxococcota bacterium]|nr:hypothetical protein [Myxococcota bacterium]